MISELETQLIAAIKASLIAPNLRAVDAMPDGDGATLIRAFASTAPAAYVVAGGGKVNDGADRHTFDILCMARNARGNNAARRGDGQTIGLYQMLDGLRSFLDGYATTSAIWNVSGYAFSKADIWRSNGLTVGSLSLYCNVMPDPAIDMSTLANFVTFHGDYDLEPFAGSAEHGKWLQEPANHATSAPDLTDTTVLPQ